MPPSMRGAGARAAHAVLCCSVHTVLCCVYGSSTTAEQLLETRWRARWHEGQSLPKKIFKFPIYIYIIYIYPSLCSSGARSSSYRLNALDEALRLAFASASNPADPAAPPPHLGYRVHVHLEKARVGGSLGISLNDPNFCRCTWATACTCTWRMHGWVGGWEISLSDWDILPPHLGYRVHVHLE